MAQLTEYDKKFIIIGSKNAITYKSIFIFLRDKRMWMGHSFNGGNAYFHVPNGDSRDWAKGVYDPATGMVKFRNVGWFTNLDFKERHDNLVLYKKYEPSYYPKFDNYDAIFVKKSRKSLMITTAFWVYQ